jgi:hypothetical protein
VIGDILQFEDLQRMCRPNPKGPLPRLATVERWARKIGLRYTYDAAGGIITTVAALNAALGVTTAANDDGKYGPDDL